MTTSNEATTGTAFNFDFMGKRLLAAIVSTILVVVAISALAINGLSLGLDFTGGSQLEVGFDQAVEIDVIREVLDEQLYTGAVPVYFGSETEVSIRFSGSLQEVAERQINSKLAELFNEGDLVISEVQPSNGEFQSIVTITGANAALVKEQQDVLFPQSIFQQVSSTIEDNRIVVSLKNSLSEAPKEPLIAALSEATGAKAELLKTDTVGPQVGEELFESAVIGGLLALGVIMVYIAMRFQFKFAIGAVVALAHDVMIVLGCFALFHWDFDLTVFAALLATIGYSLNDTIVVSDRIRENFRKLRKGLPSDVVNISLNQTVGRTLVTSLTTLLVLGCLFIFGGEAIHYFSLALIVGIVIGTYSSIYIAANVMLGMKITKEDLVVPVKEGAELDGLP